jgi:hypothetical protein
LFAGLISIAVTLSLFSVVAWAAIAIAPLPLTWVLVGALALLSGIESSSGESENCQSLPACPPLNHSQLRASGCKTVYGT